MSSSTQSSNQSWPSKMVPYVMVVIVAAIMIAIFTAAYLAPPPAPPPTYKASELNQQKLEGLEDDTIIVKGYAVFVGEDTYTTVGVNVTGTGIGNFGKPGTTGLSFDEHRVTTFNLFDDVNHTGSPVGLIDRSAGCCLLMFNSASSNELPTTFIEVEGKVVHDETEGQEQYLIQIDEVRRIEEGA